MSIQRKFPLTQLVTKSRQTRLLKSAFYVLISQIEFRIGIRLTNLRDYTAHIQEL